jgi:actin-like ATPase involved in cell morphogenesis/regulation of enolase protein 1 (concanavalin A-like superfamily)
VGSAQGVYGVGIDIGTTHTAAALWQHGRAMSVPLGGRSHSVPSVLYLREDGTMLVGEAAVQRGIVDTERVVREFKRRFGDTVPIMLGDRQFTAEDLTGQLLRWVLQMVAEREGQPPAHVTLTHPAIWRTHRRDLLVTAAQRAGLSDVGLLPEPVAAAAYYASTERLDTDALLAVYDLGGGTFDATVVRKTPSGFAIQGAPSGDDNLGGVDFDQAVMDHVTANLGSAWTTLDLEDPAVLAGVAQLREHVTAAKETLSTDTEATVPVILPGVTQRVRINREEFENAIRFRILRTVDLLAGAIASAGAEPGDVKTALLIGGSSRIPLVSRLIASELGIPVAVDAHPKYATCLGAAIATGARLDSAPATTPTPPTPQTPTESTPTPPTPAPPRPARDVGVVPKAQPAGGGTGRADTSATAPQPLSVDLADTGIAEQIDTTTSTSGAPPDWGPTPAGPGEAEQAGDGSGRRRMLIAAGAVVVTLLTVAAGVFALRDRFGSTIAGTGAASTSATSVSSTAANCGALDVDFTKGANGSLVQHNENVGSFEYQAGGLRLSAQRNTDVRGDREGKITAPWLGAPVTGDFEVVTAVQTNPQVLYQGAGLLLFVDEQHFVRFERGFGNIQAIAVEYFDGSNYVKLHGPFAWERNPVRTAAQNVELRAVRANGLISTFWREPGRDWQPLLDTAPLAGDAFVGPVVVNAAAEKDPGRKPFTGVFGFLKVTCPGTGATAMAGPEPTTNTTPAATPPTTPAKPPPARRTTTAPLPPPATTPSRSTSTTPITTLPFPSTGVTTPSGGGGGG